MTITRTRTRRHAAKSPRRRLTSLRVVLAGGVLVGLGAVASSAAWTDGATFRGSASSGAVELRACSSSTPAAPTATWVCSDADDSGSTQTILSSAAFATMVPGHSYTTTVRLHNTGTVPLAVTSTITALAEPLLGGTPTDAQLAVDPVGPATIAPLATLDLTVTVTTPGNWSIGHAGRTSPAALEVVSTGTTL